MFNFRMSHTYRRASSVASPIKMPVVGIYLHNRPQKERRWSMPDWTKRTITSSKGEGAGQVSDAAQYEQAARPQGRA
jgi:hypothetical protein